MVDVDTDAEFSPRDGSWLEFSLWYTGDTDIHDIIINGQAVRWLGSADGGLSWTAHTFSPSHVYRYYVTGYGQPLSFAIADHYPFGPMHYDDNVGGLTVRIYSITEVSNAAPAVTCPLATVVECGISANLTAVVSDPEGDAMTVAWTLNGTTIQTYLVPASSPGTVTPISISGFFPLGTNILALGVTDGTNVASCTTSVTVVDTTPPVLSQVEPLRLSCGRPITSWSG